MTDLSEIARTILQQPEQIYRVSRTSDPRTFTLEYKGAAIGELYDDGSFPTAQDIARMLNEACS